MDKQRFVEFYFPAARMAGNLYRINPVQIPRTVGHRERLG